jgi:hypothetical protein
MCACAFTHVELIGGYLTASALGGRRVTPNDIPTAIGDTSVTTLPGLVASRRPVLASRISAAGYLKAISTFSSGHVMHSREGSMPGIWQAFVAAFRHAELGIALGNNQIIGQRTFRSALRRRLTTKILLDLPPLSVVAKTSR